MTLELFSATLRQPTWESCLNSWHHPYTLLDNKACGDSLMESYQKAAESSSADILGYVHDDVVCLVDDWKARVMAEFDDSEVGLVGFGGALSHGTPDIYRTSYVLTQIGRGKFLSNMKEAENHGRRFQGSCDVAVLDGFVLFVRKAILDKCGGWPVDSKVGYIGYDYWISCMTRRLGYRIRLVGVSCDHLGGKSTGLNPELDVDFDGAHRAIYDEFRDVLPFEVSQ
ncbi:MAG: glycosyltransferase family 2 protein [Patescibacteria group bacterium]|nr:glycosyltransferase family 2 protein [Patescibacteria group bacterium]